MRRLHQRLRPLTPIFDPDIRRGLIDTATTPGVTPDGLLYAAMRDAGPLALWDFTEASGQFQDSSVGGVDHTTSIGTVTTYQNWTGPDSKVRASLAASSVNQGWIVNPPSADLLTFPLTWVVAYGAGSKTGVNGIFGIDGSTNGYFKCYWDASTYFYVYLHRDTGALYRYWRYSVNSTTWDSVRLISVAMTDNDTTPTVKFNGSAQTLASSSAPTGTVNVGSRLYLAGYRASSAQIASAGPMAIYSGTSPDLASIESAAVTEGWY